MSRIPKWKLEKTKIKVVFRLQFHATHVPLTGWDKLFLSFIPEDVGRVTAKTNKANVRNGACKWADPIYETTRLIQDTIAKKYEDKLYKLVVAMGTSRSSCLGEAYINLSDYADALKPVSATLPLEGCKFGTILHVSIQLLTSKTGFREFEVQREIREKSFHQISNPCHEPVREVGDSSNKIMDTVDWLLSLKIPANGNFPPENTDYAVDIEDQRREQENLKAGIKRLKEELDRIKNENLESPLSEVGQELLDPSLRGLEKKFLQLEMANRNLGTLFPSLQDPPCSSGSALERVLALELELAEALQAKKPNSAFQSSFARPPGDDVAVLRSFRDINELIGDVLNAKGRHAAMESELNDMHSRFSQLSLQLAEVEGERQKLLMKLKNSRSPRKS